MYKSITLAAAITTALLTTGCQKAAEERKEDAAPPPPAVDLAAEEQAIRNRSGEWMNYVNAKDMASVANGIAAPDAVFISEDKAYRGTAAIQAAGEAAIKEEPDAVVSWTSDQVRVAESGDLAVEIGSFNFDPDGDGKKPAVQGTFATTWVKTDGQWRVLSDAGGENPAAAKP
jgi:uncharacterized protein (TIGR02246 family)